MRETPSSIWPRLRRRRCSRCASTPPLDWRYWPEVTRDLGTAWLRKIETVLLRIPSAIVPETGNVLFNPRHADAKSFRIAETFLHPFDAGSKNWNSSYRAVHPPSITSVCPVINEAAGEARNTTAPDTSTGSPIRCSAAMRSTTSARNSGSSSAGAVPGV